MFSYEKNKLVLLNIPYELMLYMCFYAILHTYTKQEVKRIQYGNYIAFLFSYGTPASNFYCIYLKLSGIVFRSQSSNYGIDLPQQIKAQVYVCFLFSFCCCCCQQSHILQFMLISLELVSKLLNQIIQVCPGYTNCG